MSDHEFLFIASRSVETHGGSCCVFGYLNKCSKIIYFKEIIKIMILL